MTLSEFEGSDILVIILKFFSLFDYQVQEQNDL
jgi:hypothetical protein